MAGTIRVKADRLADAADALKQLETELKELEVFPEQEEGGCGKACEKMEEIRQELEEIPQMLGQLTKATVSFLEGTMKSMEESDKPVQGTAGKGGA